MSQPEEESKRELRPIRRDFLKEWSLTPEEANEIIAENPPVYSTISGFVAEYKFKKTCLLRPEITDLCRPRASDRKSKGDFRFRYQGQDFSIEVKSLDTPKVRRTNGGYKGTFQCNASDSREVRLPDGSKVTTNCLLVGEFDVLAVSLFAFEQKWWFGFARHRDLPRSTWKKCEPKQRQYLLKSSMGITWPLCPPYHKDLFQLLDAIARERKK